jgi:hypothetical protein
VGVSYAFEDQGTRNVIVLEFFGPVTIEERAAALSEVGEKRRQTGHTNLLADFSSAWAVEEAPEQVQRYATALAHAPAIEGMRIAYVSQRRSPTRVPIETIAAINGYFFQRFSTKEAALKWLE